MNGNIFVGTGSRYNVQCNVVPRPDLVISPLCICLVRLVNGNIFVGTGSWYNVQCNVVPRPDLGGAGSTRDPLAEKIGNSKTNFNPQVLFINCRV